MRKPISRIEVEYKIKFLNRFMDEKFIFLFEESKITSNDFALFKDYGCEGSNCIFVGNLSDCNKYLNKYLKKHDLREMWEDYKNNI